MNKKILIGTIGTSVSIVTMVPAPVVLNTKINDKNDEIARLNKVIKDNKIEDLNNTTKELNTSIRTKENQIKVHDPNIKQQEKADTKALRFLRRLISYLAKNHQVEVYNILSVGS